MKRLPEPSTNDAKQSGFTLIELMISIVIGLIILAAVVGLFVSMTKSDSDNLKAIRLNQQLRATMSLIARDLRRAGANRNAATDSAPPAPTNPFSIAGGTRLTIANYNGKANAQVTYSYDVDVDPAACTAENFGYRWNSNSGNNGIWSVESFSGSSAGGCGAGAWTTVTDSDLVEITDEGQTASPGYVAGTPRGLRFADSFIDEAGIRVHQITITLWGRLKKDHSVMRSLSETIKIRNDEILP